MEISYYDLLGMIQDGNAPKKIEVSLTYGTSREYNAEYDADEFNYYRLDENKLEDENYKDYLSECFLESTMFDKCIKILDDADEFIDIDELSIFEHNNSIETVKGAWTGRNLDKALAYIINDLIKNQKKLIERSKNENN